MAFRPISANTSSSHHSNPVARKVHISERTGGATTPRPGVTSSTSSSAAPTSRFGVTPRTGNPSSSSAAPLVSEEELAKQRQLQSEFEALEAELRASEIRSEQLRRRIHAQCDSQARLVGDNEEWTLKHAAKRAAKIAEYRATEAAAEANLQKELAAQSAAEETARAAAAVCAEAMRRRDEANEALVMTQESVANRKTLIAMEGNKQFEIKRNLAVVEAEITVLEQKKREQIEKMDELKAKVESTRQLERDALADLEARKQVLATLQKNIDALKKLQRGEK